VCGHLAGPSSDAVLREQSKRGQGCCGVLLMIISVFMIVITFPIAICLSLKVSKPGDLFFVTNLEAPTLLDST
jgi:hypothetical protein